MNIAEIAARNRRQKMEQLQRLRPVYHQTKAEREELSKAKAGAGTARQGMELMKKLKHVPGFFPTPPAIVRQMIELAGDVTGKTVLEPSAGKGNIADAVAKAGAKVVCVEHIQDLCVLLRNSGHATLGADFLKCSGRDLDKYDFVLMNPPFERKQDIAHVQHAFCFLKDGGRLVAIVSSTSGSALGDWASQRNGYVEPLPAGSFATSERPTGVNCSIVVAEK